MIRYDGDNHHEDGNERKPPVEESRRRLQHASNLENDQLEQRKTEREGYREDELDADMLDLVVLEQLLHEEYYSADEEQNLGVTIW